MFMLKNARMRSVMLLFGAAMLAAVSFGCGGAAKTGPSANTANTAVSKNTNSDSTAASNTANTSNTSAEPANAAPGPAGSQATPSDTYRTAYELRKKKDVAGLKKVLSPDALDFLKTIGEADTPKKSLDEMISEMFETEQADKAEVRNEVIKGDRATVEYLTKEGTWKTMDFEKVDGKWLIGFPKADKPSGMDDEKK